MDNERIESIKIKRDEFLAQLKELTEEQYRLNHKIDAVKKEIRKKTDEYIQQFIDQFKPGSTWFIDTGYCYEYFKVTKCSLNHYAYREEDFDDCAIDIYGQYIQVPNPNNLEYMDRVHVQFKTKETISFKIKEIPQIKEVSFETWAEVLKIMYETATEK